MAHVRPIVRHEFEQLWDAPAEGKREDPWTGGFHETKSRQHGTVEFDVSIRRYRPCPKHRKSAWLHMAVQGSFESPIRLREFCVNASLLSGRLVELKHSYASYELSTVRG